MAAANGVPIRLSREKESLFSFFLCQGKRKVYFFLDLVSEGAEGAAADDVAVIGADHVVGENNVGAVGDGAGDSAGDDEDAAIGVGEASDGTNDALEDADAASLEGESAGDADAGDSAAGGDGDGNAAGSDDFDVVGSEVDEHFFYFFLDLVVRVDDRIDNAEEREPESAVCACAEEDGSAANIAGAEEISRHFFSLSIQQVRKINRRLGTGSRRPSVY